MQNTNLTLNLTNHIIKKCHKTWKLDDREIKFNDLTFVLSGKAVYFVDGKKQELFAGDAVFLKESSRREAYTFEDDPFSCAAFNFANLSDFDINLPNKFSWEENVKIKSLIQELNVEWLKKDELYKIKCNSILNLIICECMSLKKNSHVNETTENIKTYILNNLPAKLTVQKIAYKMGIHPAYCGNLFIKNEKMSIQKYINIMRVRQAKNLLQEHDLPIALVGENVGFDDPYYFSKIFKDIEGVSPKKYKEQIKNMSKI